MFKKVIVGIVVLALMAASGFAGYIIGSGSTEQADVEPTPEVSPTPTPVTAAPDYIAIGTEFGELRFPEQWTEFLVTDQTPQGGSLYVEFAAMFDGAKYPMFTVIIGPGEGMQVGMITDAVGTQRPVYLIVEDIENVSTLDDGEQQRLFAMQEDLNYLIDNLK